MNANERFVVLLRHGIAEPADGSKSDALRALTGEGHEHMQQIGRRLAEVFPKAEKIYTSPLVRCVETASWVVKGYDGAIAVEETSALRPGATTSEFRTLLADRREQRLICVGHEPTLSDFALALTGMSGYLELKKGGCYGIRLSGRSGRLEWMFPPRVLR